MNRPQRLPDVRFAVLGPLKAWRGAAEVPLGPPKRQAVLSALLVQSGRPVPLDMIVDVVWGAEPPARAENIVHQHVGALRRMLEPHLASRAEASRLVRRSGGYLLDLNRNTLDLLRFRDLREQAQSAAARAVPGQATQLLMEALALWRGPVGLGLPAPVRRHPLLATVDGEYSTAAKEAADAALAAGSEAVVLKPLRQAADLDPLDEALQARLVRVLAGAGQRAEALEHYRGVCSRLAATLGLDPGPELREAYEQVARGPGAGGRGVPSPRPPAPDEPDCRAQLPPRPEAFIGREDDLALLDAALPAEGTTSPATVITVVGGAPGTGKTTLAVHWAHQVADRFPDGQLYVDLLGYAADGAVLRPGEAIRSLLEGFGVPAGRMPTDLDAQAAMYRSLFAGRRVLVVLDNARSAEQVRPLLPGAPGCMVVVTSRDQLSGLLVFHGARYLLLEALSTDEALEFLSRRLGARRVADEPSAALEIVERCGRLPLALAVVCARAAARPTAAPADLAGELRRSHGGPDTFATGGTAPDVRAVFSWSYRALPPTAARLFRLLSLCPGSEVSLHAAAALAGLEPRDARAALGELTRAQLCTEHRPDRFAAHGLLRAYSHELARGDDPEEYLAARRRLLDHYLHSAHAAVTRLAPHFEKVPLAAPVAGAAPLVFDDHDRAHAWLTTERSVLQAAVEQDVNDGVGEYAWRLALVLEWFLDRVGRWQDHFREQSSPLTNARRPGHVTAREHAHRALGFAGGRLERRVEAQAHLRRARELFAEIGDLTGQGRVLRHLAFLANSCGEHRTALRHYEEAERLYESVGCPGGRAAIANEIGWTLMLLGEYGAALKKCRRAVSLARDIGDSSVEAASWGSVGGIHARLGEHHEALRAYDHALALYRRIIDARPTAGTLMNIGDAHAAADAAERARAAWREALDILEGIGHPQAEEVRRRLDGRARRPPEE